MSELVSLLSGQHLVVFLFYTPFLWACSDVGDFDLHFPSDPEHLPACSFAVCVSSSVMSLFMPFAHYLIVFLFFNF